MANRLAEAKIGIEDLVFGNKKKVTKERDPEGQYVLKTKERVKGTGDNTITRKKEKIRRTLRGAYDEATPVSKMSSSEKEALKRKITGEKEPLMPMKEKYAPKAEPQEVGKIKDRIEQSVKMTRNKL